MKQKLLKDFGDGWYVFVSQASPYSEIVFTLTNTDKDKFHSNNRIYMPGRSTIYHDFCSLEDAKHYHDELLYREHHYKSLFD